MSWRPKRPVVLCDMDAIVVDLGPYWLEEIAKDHGIKVHQSEIDLWDMHKCGGLQKLKPDQIYAYLQKPGFFLNAPPIDGALEALKELHEETELHIISSPSGPVSAKEKLEWLAEHAPFIPAKNIMLANQKTLVRGDVLIDDHPDTLPAYAEAWPDALPIGIEYPYNRHLYQNPRVVLVADYQNTRRAWNLILDDIAIWNARR